MDWTCPICGKTFKRINQGHKCFSGSSPELAFAGKKTKWLSLYLALQEIVRARVTFDCEYAPSGGAQWRRRSIFASMHGETKGLYVNFLSDQRLDDGYARILSVTPISAHRLLHIACIDDPSQIPVIAEYIVSSYAVTEQAGPTGCWKG